MQPKTKIPSKLKEGDLVLIKNHTTKSFKPWYVGDYRMVSQKGNQVDVKPAQGRSTHFVHVSDVKYVVPIDVFSKIQPTTLSLNPNKIPDLGWQMSTALNTNQKYQVPSTKDLTVVNSQMQNTIVTT